MSAPKPPMPGNPIIVLMGVSGAGKTTVGTRIAALLEVEFAEGDRFHPEANVKKMSSGAPLDDSDRLPWLKAIAGEIDCARDAGRGLVVTCSALKRAYREILLGGRPEVRLVYLRGSRALIERRLNGRRGHFMPSALLPSQFAALEEPDATEAPIVVDISAAPESIAAAVARQIAVRR